MVERGLLLQMVKAGLGAGERERVVVGGVLRAVEVGGDGVESRLVKLVRVLVVVSVVGGRVVGGKIVG